MNLIGLLGSNILDPLELRAGAKRIGGRVPIGELVFATCFGQDRLFHFRRWRRVAAEIIRSPDPWKIRRVGIAENKHRAADCPVRVAAVPAMISVQTRRRS